MGRYESVPGGLMSMWLNTSKYSKHAYSGCDRHLTARLIVKNNLHTLSLKMLQVCQMF